MKKVMHVIVGLEVGGAELMLKRLILDSRKKITHSVVSLTDIGPVGRLLGEHGIQVMALNTTSFLSKCFLIFRVVKAIRIISPDVVHTWMYHSDLVGGVAAKVVGVKNIVWCIRSNDITKGGSRLTLVIRRVCAILSRWVPNKIVCAAYASKITHSRIGYDTTKIVVIPNGFVFSDTKAPSNFDIVDFRNENGISSSDILIVSVARYNEVKDHRSFVAASVLLKGKHSNLKFLLVGRGITEANTNLVSILNEFGMSDEFILLGEQSNVQRCLGASDIYCLHSVTEGFPNALGEAMLARLPCVATDVGDAALLLGDGSYIVPPSNPKALANAIDKLLMLEKEEREDIGGRLRERVIENFSIERMTMRYLELY